MSIHPTLKVPALAERRLRGGFTLVELLIVITIIGVLVGLLVPAAAMVRRSVQQAAIAMEVQALANAIEQYKNKYGEYPPDGSSLDVFRRHMRKAFPNAVPSEMELLYNFANRYPQLGNIPANFAAVGVMDPPEALVFFLGGFSSDEQHPFTGEGGPLYLQLADGTRVQSDYRFPGDIASVQYNVDRSEPLYDFKQSQLTLDVITIQGAPTPITVSTDEVNLLGAGASLVDCLPVYLTGGKRQAPFVYFEGRTYSIGSGSNRYFNAYSPAISEMGVARPYKSTELNTTSTSDPDRYYRYMNERAFQIVSAGLDDSFGGLSTTSAGTVLFRYPTGEKLMFPANGQAPQLEGSRYIESDGIPSTQLDNATNFSDGILENALD